MRHKRVVQGLTATFGGLSLALAVVGLIANPAILILAVIFGAIAGLLYYQASGKLAQRVYQRIERQAAVNGGARADHGGFGAGPRKNWRGPHRRRNSSRKGKRAKRRRDGIDPRDSNAYATLGLEPDADQATIREAYRERIKEVHPDTETGNEAAFRRVRNAYEQLAE